MIILQVIINFKNIKRKDRSFFFVLNFAIQEDMKIMIGFRVTKEFKEFLQNDIGCTKHQAKQITESPMEIIKSTLESGAEKG